MSCMKPKTLFQNDCPTYTINLDKPEEERWAHIVPDFKDKIHLATKLADDMLGETAQMVLVPMLGMACKTGVVLYSNELKGIARDTGISVGRVLMLQLAYEAFAACTSVVVQGPRHPIHIRTMDWDLPELKALTINVVYKSRGQVVFRGTTWAGYIGILTGMKPRSFSVSINYRRTRQCNDSPALAFSKNIYRCVAGYWPIGYLVREVLTSQKCYSDAVAEFQESELVAPTYITVCGTKKHEGAIITRDRSPGLRQSDNFTTQLADGNLVQANMDHHRDEEMTDEIFRDKEEDWQDICESRSRKMFVQRALEQIDGVYNINNLGLIMATDPCFSRDLTIYTSLMIPALRSMKTWTKVPAKLQRMGKKKFASSIRESKQIKSRTNPLHLKA